MFFDPQQMLRQYQIEVLPDANFLHYMESFGEQNCLKILSFIFNSLNIQNLRSIRLSRLEQRPGHSINIRIDLFDKSYVLRILLPYAHNDHRSIETYFSKNASLIGLAPHIYRIDQSASFHLILMDYVDSPTLGDKPIPFSNILSSIAKSLQKISQLPADIPPSFPIREGLKRDLDLMEMQNQLTPQMTECLPFLRKIFESLEKQQIALAPSHGDLNPYNIFFDKERILLIDWSFAGLHEKFFDIGYFSATAFLNKETELLLLNQYLGRSPSMHEEAIFYLMKQLARFRLGTRLQGYCNLHSDSKIEKIRDEAFRQFKLHARSGEMIQVYSLLNKEQN